MSNRTILTLALSITLAACSSTPDRSGSLDQARANYRTAQNDPQVQSLAPAELRRAGESLELAERAFNDRDQRHNVDHLAYMANQQVTIAQATASSQAAQNITLGAAAERDQMLLQQRTAQVDYAQMHLRASERDNAQLNMDLDRADDNARIDQQRVERSDARVDALEMQLIALDAKKTDRGMVVTLGDVLFNTGQAQLLPDRSGNMNKLADFFKQYPNRTAAIEGYTDSVGSAAFNYDLAQRRANAVKMALTDRGVPADRLTTRAFGQENPTSSNETSAGRQLNRRVEIVFAPEREDMSMQ
jgi:outer membrane protein OmpA-like peptidoglycan-associated protein